MFKTRILNIFKKKIIGIIKMGVMVFIYACNATYIDTRERGEPRHGAE